MLKKDQAGCIRVCPRSNKKKDLLFSFTNFQAILKVPDREHVNHHRHQAAMQVPVVTVNETASHWIDSLITSELATQSMF